MNKRERTRLEIWVNLITDKLISTVIFIPFACRFASVQFYFLSPPIAFHSAWFRTNIHHLAPSIHSSILSVRCSWQSYFLHLSLPARFPKFFTIADIRALFRVSFNGKRNETKNWYIIQVVRWIIVMLLSGSVLISNDEPKNINKILWQITR